MFLSDAGGCWHTAGEGLREFLDAAANERMVRSIFEETRCLSSRRRGHGHQPVTTAPAAYINQL